MTREEFAKTIDYAMLWQNTPRDLLKKALRKRGEVRVSWHLLFPQRCQDRPRDHRRQGRRVRGRRLSDGYEHDKGQGVRGPRRD